VSVFLSICGEHTSKCSRELKAMYLDLGAMGRADALLGLLVRPFLHRPHLCTDHTRTPHPYATPTTHTHAIVLNTSPAPISPREQPPRLVHPYQAKSNQVKSSHREREQPLGLLHLTTRRLGERVGAAGQRARRRVGFHEDVGAKCSERLLCKSHVTRATEPHSKSCMGTCV
jgi:hypothetical protein